MRPQALALLLAAALTPTLPARAEPVDEGAGPGPAAALTIGGASIRFDAPGGLEQRQDGVALGVRAARRYSERFGSAVTFTWGLTDWDRAREWIDAGNEAGHWTTDRMAQVARWVGEGDEDQALRFLAAVFAEPFLAITYIAVPVCYVGSLGGATSHLQVDLTGTIHSGQGPIELWAEGGVGAAGIPRHFMEWDYALGPVVGAGVDAGPLRIGGRVLWSPGGLNSSPRADRQLFTASLTVGARY